MNKKTSVVKICFILCYNVKHESPRFFNKFNKYGRKFKKNLFS